MGRWRLCWSDVWYERKAVREADRILSEASRADPETMGRIIDLMRAPEQGYSTRTQVEVDGVIARYRAAHPELRGGAGMTGPGPR